MTYELWTPTLHGWRCDRTYGRRWQARVAAWLWDHSLPRDSWFRGAKVVPEGESPHDERGARTVK